MSDDVLTDEELTLEEERQLQKLKEESKPLENLAFLISRTRGFEGLLKKDRKRKEAKRQKEKLKTENSMSPTAQDETVFPGSSSNQEPSDRTETATPPLHVRLATDLINVPLQSPSARKIPRSQKVEIYSESRTTWLPVIAFLDTGTSDNWISLRIIERGSFRPRYGQTIHYADFNGVHLQSDGVVDITWSGAGRAKSHEASFRVGRETAPFDVLFGLNILNSDEVGECLTTQLLDPNAVLVQLEACNAENLVIEQNRTKNEAQAAELAKQQELKKLAEKQKSKLALDVKNKTTSENRAGCSATGQSGRS